MSPAFFPPPKQEEIGRLLGDFLFVAHFPPMRGGLCAAWGETKDTFFSSRCCPTLPPTSAAKAGTTLPSHPTTIEGGLSGTAKAVGDDIHRSDLQGLDRRRATAMGQEK